MPMQAGRGKAPSGSLQRQKRQVPLCSLADCVRIYAILCARLFQAHSSIWNENGGWQNRNGYWCIHAPVQGSAIIPCIRIHMY